jgi:hypothetical protein
MDSDGVDGLGGCLINKKQKGSPGIKKLKEGRP